MELHDSRPNVKLAINCFCGLLRIVPPGLKVGDTFELAPCPKCHTPFRGKCVEGGVELVTE
jgi:hypothetical protein